MEQGWPNVAAPRGRGSNLQRVRGSSGRPQSALHQQSSSSYGYTQGGPYTVSAQQSATSLKPPLQRFLSQSPGVEPVNVQPQMMGLGGYGPRGASQTDLTLPSDPQNNFDNSLFANFDISGPVQSASNFPPVAHNHQEINWVGQYPVPAPTGNQSHPDPIPAPNPAPATLTRPGYNVPDAEGETRRPKRPRAPTPKLKNIAPEHRYYDLFNYPEYQPPKTPSGTAMGTRSMDHHPDSDLGTVYASYLFQNNPIDYWILRDVAEKVPTKIREKEIAYLKQLGSSSQAEATLVESKGKKIVGATKSAFRKAFTPERKGKRPKTSQEGVVMVSKGRRNWNDNYAEKYPGQPVPSSVPNWRPTVHALLHAGRSTEGPQDFNSRLINTLKRCDDPEFRMLLVEKLESYRHSPPYLAQEQECSEPIQLENPHGAIDPHPHHAEFYEGAPTDTSTQVHRISRNSSLRGCNVFNRNPQREPSSANAISQDFSGIHFAPSLQIQTNLRSSYHPENSAARAVSATGSGRFLTPTGYSTGGDGPMSDGVSSLFSSHEDADGMFQSHQGTTVPEADIGTSGFSVADDIGIGYPYPPADDLESDIKT